MAKKAKKDRFMKKLDLEDDENYPKKEKEYQTYHLMIIDRSGSMDTVKAETISGLNEQLHSIRKAQEEHDEQEQKVCLVVFSSTVDHSEMWNMNIDDVEDFTEETYVPDGMTALLDAVGMGVSKLREEIKDKLAEKKANIIMTIFTDGMENNSKEYNGQQILSLIKEIKETGYWAVSFAGCSDDVFEVAKSMGIAEGDTLHYAAGSVGTQHAFARMAQSRTNYTNSYSMSIAQGLDTAAVNKAENFFENTTNLNETKSLNETKEENKLTEGPNSA